MVARRLYLAGGMLVYSPQKLSFLAWAAALMLLVVVSRARGISSEHCAAQPLFYYPKPQIYMAGW